MTIQQRIDFEREHKLKEFGVEKVCEWCGTPFMGLKAHKYCCVKCECSAHDKSLIPLVVPAR